MQKELVTKKEKLKSPYSIFLPLDLLIILFALFIKSNILRQDQKINYFIDSFPLTLFEEELKNIDGFNFNRFIGVRPIINRKSRKFAISANYQMLYNNGHPNVDNNGEFYALDKQNNFISIINYITVLISEEKDGNG